MEVPTKNVKYHAIILSAKGEIAGFWRHSRRQPALAWRCAVLRATCLLALFALFLVGPPGFARTSSGADDKAIASMSVSQLPAEAREVLPLIQAGGPFSYAKDGQYSAIANGGCRCSGTVTIASTPFPRQGPGTAVRAALSPAATVSSITLKITTDTSDALWNSGCIPLQPF